MTLQELAALHEMPVDSLLSMPVDELQALLPKQEGPTPMPQESLAITGMKAFAEKMGIPNIPPKPPKALQTADSLAVEGIKELAKNIGIEPFFEVNQLDTGNPRLNAILKGLVGRRGMQGLDLIRRGGEGVYDVGSQTINDLAAYITGKNQEVYQNWGNLVEAYGLEDSWLGEYLTEKHVFDDKGRKVGVQWDNPKAMNFTPGGGNTPMSRVQTYVKAMEQNTPQGPITQEIRRSDMKSIPGMTPEVYGTKVPNVPYQGISPEDLLDILGDVDPNHPMLKALSTQ